MKLAGRHLRSLRLAACALAPLCMATAAIAAVQEPGTDEPISMKAEAPITAVTVYPGRAAVTRTTTVSVEQGVFVLQFEGLPAAIQPETLQARVGDAARLVNVEYLETAVPELTGSPAMVALDSEIEAARRALERQREDRALLAAQSRIIDQIGVRAAGDATREAGTEQLSIESLRKQLEFVQSERARLLTADRAFVDRIRAAEHELAALESKRAAMGGGERVVRSAEVTMAVPSAGSIPVSLTYLVANAGWEAAYSVRSAGDRSQVTLEFDATLLQRSGEDWVDVAMTISTAQPTMRANPPTITPLYVSVQAPPPPMSAPAAPGMPPGRKPGRGSGGAVEGAAPAPGLEMDGGQPEAFAYSKSDPEGKAAAQREQRSAELQAWSSGAAVIEGGTAVSFELPRKVTVPSTTERRTRTRVATITPKATFVYTAVPLLTDAVYLRSRLSNESPYQLVPGPAQVFMGTEYVGPTRLDGVVPGGEFTIYFGIDRSIRAVRTLVSRNTSESGVFSKSRETTREYRIVIENGSGRSIDLELFDRRPMSQDEKITVAVDALSAPLSTNAEFVRDQLPQGIMRWDLTVPATSIGANAMTITWTTRVSAPRDLQITAVPD